MKRFLKVLLIFLLSVFTILVLTAGIVSWLVFTPERITPIVQKQADKIITCESEIGEVDLTFFSTYPNVGLKLRHVVLINPVEDAPGDTLLRVDELTAVVDADAWRKRKELVLVGLELRGGSINGFSDSLGNTNYDILSGDTVPSPERDTETIMPLIDIRNVVLEDVNLHYNDLALRLNAVVKGLDAEMAGAVTPDQVNGSLEVKKSLISLEYDGEKYLEQASIGLDLPVDFMPARQLISLDKARLTVNGLELWLNGSLENDTIQQTLITDLDYQLSSWKVENILALVPPSLHSHLEGIEVDGFLTSEGSIKGQLNDSLMPWMDIHLSLENGDMEYDAFPLPLHAVSADINFYSDLKTDELSYLRINRFDASTPQSSVKVRGLINHLFTDLHCDLVTNPRLRLDEFAPMIPDSLDATVNGLLSGELKSKFTLSQLKKMQVGKIKLSGSVTLRDFYAAYDSMSFRTNRSGIDFALPNPGVSTQNTDFVFAAVNTENLSAGKIDSYDAYLENASILLETSDFRDTTRIPDINCSFRMDSLYAGMDTLSIAVRNPDGEMSLFPRYQRPDQARILVSYSSDQIHADAGHQSADIKDISLETDIQNDNTQEDIFLQWMVKGFLDMNQGRITLADNPHPVDIPAVKMDFEPETFSIQEASLKYDKSDFQLTGVANNVLSYFRGDSILRGNFSFVSNATDLSQIMALTSGLGSEDTTALEKDEAPGGDSTYTGPYMVPQGMDLLLNTSIKKATLGMDTISDITGDVRVKDGVLLLDGLRLQTPAARMQVTSMYRTPRKNHIYIGLDYHMLDVEISELLSMIPDIDTLMPMLRSFSGEAEFHIAVETYMDSLYNIKKSTLRGASSIRGSNLVLMDGETFSEIANKLKFNKKTENKVDSLSAEFTIFRNEIDIYPFLIVMDKYKAVIAGRHNFDMSFNYHVSLVESPIPIKLGVDLNGNVEDLNVDLAKCRYAEFYRPASRHAVENKQLELRAMIREILTQKVK